MSDHDRHDQALAWLAPYGPDLAWGFTSHHPMVVEALATLGRPEAALPWLEAHRDGLLPRKPATRPIAADADAALGQADRFPDWEQHFRDALERKPWREVVSAWGPRLAPGLVGAATHGMIRTAHAARALAAADTPLRRNELAAGLAYWAATFQTLPASEAVDERPTGAAEALATVPMVRDLRPESASIVGALESLDDFPAFAPVIERLDVARDPDDVVSDLTVTFARVLLASAHDRLGAIVFTHGVTSAETLRTLLPLLPEAARPAALRFAWQAGAALHATYGVALPEDDGDAPEPSRDSLVAAALAGGDDHAIKLTTACLGEYERTGARVLLAAARRGSDLLAPPGA